MHYALSPFYCSSVTNLDMSYNRTHVMFLMSRRATDGVCTHRYHVGRACPAPAGSCSRISICRDTAPAESAARWMSGADEDLRSRSRHHRAVKSARVAEGAADWPPARRRRCTTHCDVFLGPVRRGARPGRREGRRRASRGPCGVITSTRPVRERTRERGAARVPRLARHALLPWGRGGACARTPLSHRRARRGSARRPSVGSGRHMSRDHLVTTT